jgi:hypothetical protein
LEELWANYLKKKYQVALQNWYGHTGGGSGDVEEFHHPQYIGKDGWIAWVYFLDQEKGGLIESCTSG